MLIRGLWGGAGVLGEKSRCIRITLPIHLDQTLFCTYFHLPVCRLQSLSKALLPNLHFTWPFQCLPNTISWMVLWLAFAQFWILTCQKSQSAFTLRLTSVKKKGCHASPCITTEDVTSVSDTLHFIDCVLKSSDCCSLEGLKNWDKLVSRSFQPVLRVLRSLEMRERKLQRGCASAGSGDEVPTPKACSEF